MSNFKIGDKVVVVDSGRTYSLYDEWANRVGLNKWAQGERLSDKDEAIVVALAPWGNSGSGDILLAVEKDGKQYIMGENGVEKYVEDTRTPAQKAGLIIGQRYQVAEVAYTAGRGKVVYFIEDDGSSNPYFGDFPGAFDYCVGVTDVTPYVEPKNTVIEFDKVLTEAQIAAIKTLVA